MTLRRLAAKHIVTVTFAKSREKYSNTIFFIKITYTKVFAFSSPFFVSSLGFTVVVLAIT
jgi:hypothetical protein